RNLIASPAFLPDWRDQELGYLLGQTPGDEIVTLIRLIPGFRGRVLALAPQITAQIITEELEAADRSSEQDRITRLANLRERMTRAIGELGLTLPAVYGASDLASRPPPEVESPREAA
ncbi:MAG: hypothetical protein AAB425_13550, partial [Bdellovibrionota bacterium]